MSSDLERVSNAETMFAGKHAVEPDFVSSRRFAALPQVPGAAAKGGIVSHKPDDLLLTVQLRDSNRQHDRRRPSDAARRGDGANGLAWQELAGAGARAPDALGHDGHRPGRGIEVDRGTAGDALTQAQEKENEHHRQGDTGNAQAKPELILQQVLDRQLHWFLPIPPRWGLRQQ